MVGYVGYDVLILLSIAKGEDIVSKGEIKFKIK